MCVGARLWPSRKRSRRADCNAYLGAALVAVAGADVQWRVAVIVRRMHVGPMHEQKEDALDLVPPAGLAKEQPPH